MRDGGVIDGVALSGCVAKVNWSTEGPRLHIVENQRGDFLPWY